MKSRPHIYRERDLVEIVNPLVVLRVGYPISLADAYDTIEKEMAADVHDLNAKISALARKATGKSPSESIGELSNALIFDSFQTDPLTDAPIRDNPIIWQLARQYLPLVGYGGRQRSIHTVMKPELRDKVARVVGKRCVKTGEYYPPRGGYSQWDGDYDVEPGGLTDVKTHVLLELAVSREGHFFSINDVFEIEACHVVPLVELQSIP